MGPQTEGNKDNWLCRGKVLFDLGFIPKVTRAAVMSEQDEVVILLQVPKNVVRADLAAGVHGQKFSSLNPQYFHQLAAR